MSLPRSTLLATALALLVGMVGATASQAGEHSQTSGLDRFYIKTAISGDRIEIRAGRLALHKSDNPKVRRLARTLVRDHGKSKREAIELARDYGVAVPSAPEPEQMWALRTLQRFQGGRFDRRYAAYEIRDHHQDIADARNEAEQGYNLEFRDEAKQELPMLKRHLKLAKRTQAAVLGR
jgi:putative membrane protein